MRSAATVRVGVIGRGIGAHVVAPVFEETDGCTVVDVVSPRDDDAVTALCARDDVDLISVHSPPFLHLDHVRRAIEHGHAVLCDKPFGLNALEAEEMHDLAHDAGTLNLVNYEFRYHPVRSKLRALVLDGVVGTVEHVQWSAFASIWRTVSRPVRLDVRRGARRRLGASVRKPQHRLLPLVVRRDRGRLGRRSGPRSRNGSTPKGACTSALPKTA